MRSDVYGLFFNIAEEKAMKLLICGDTVPTEYSAPLFEAGDTDALFGRVKEEFAAHDRVIVNLECALTASEHRIRKFGPNLKGPVQTAATLRAAGVTDCAIANNHILDFGVGGLRDTEGLLDAAGLQWFGCGENARKAKRPHYIERDGQKIAVLAFNEHEYTYALDDQAGAAPFDPFDAMTEIARVKKTADYLVVLYHGGKEYCEYPSPRLRELCRAMTELGADVVLCQHSHIIGCAEEHAGGTIVYGQGNFHFVGFDELPFWSRGLMISLDFDEGLRVRAIPVVAGERGIDLAGAEEARAILDGFRARSEALKDGRWLDGWRRFVRENGAGYLDCVRQALDGDETHRERMAHYLDCEAHLDMLRELFRTWHNTQTDGAQEE